MHVKVRDGLVSVGVVAGFKGDGRGVGGAGGKGDVGFAAAGNSGIDRSDVFGVGAGKQGGKGNVLIVGFGAGIQISVVVHDFPSVAHVKVGVAAGEAADAVKLAGGGRAAKHPESLISGVVLALVNINEQLRLRLFQRRQSKQSRGG